MRENKIRTIWDEGGAVLNGWLHIPSSWSAEVMAHQGWDSLTVDMQHGMMGFQAALTMLQAISRYAPAPMVLDHDGTLRSTVLPTAGSVPSAPGSRSPDQATS